MGRARRSLGWDRLAPRKTVLWCPPGLRSKAAALSYARRYYRLPDYRGCTYNRRTGRLVLV